MTRILALTKGDIVRDSSGTVGKVASIHVDRVRIAWDDGQVLPYTDEDLKAHGVELVR